MDVIFHVLVANHISVILHYTLILKLNIMANRNLAEVQFQKRRIRKMLKKINRKKFKRIKITIIWKHSGNI